MGGERGFLCCSLGLVVLLLLVLVPPSVCLRLLKERASVADEACGEETLLLRRDENDFGSYNPRNITVTYRGGSELVAAQSPEMTSLQKHVAFFDRNKDGIIYPSETYQGFRAIGVDVALSAASSVLINGFLSAKTLPAGKSPSPLLPVYVENIAKAIHGSDTGVYDSDGNFVEAKFEEIFQKFAKANSNALTSDEVAEMLKANQDPNDSKSAAASAAEWKILYRLGKDKDGLLQKETVRSVFDGSLFYNLEKAKQQSS